MGAGKREKTGHLIPPGEKGHSYLKKAPIENDTCSDVRNDLDGKGRQRKICRGGRLIKGTTKKPGIFSRW